jgi:hypothetical protein
MQNYQPSGRFSPMAFALFLVALAVVIGIAFVYQLALNWIPFIYINFLLTLGLGLVVGKAASIIIKQGHVRNWPLGVFFFAGLVLVALGAKFGFQYLSARYEVAQLTPADLGIEVEGGITPEQMADFQKTVLDNYTFSEHIMARVENGWNVGKGGKMPLSGPFVYLIWAIELGVVGFFGWTIVSETIHQPYSEKLQSWADQTSVELNLPITKDDMVSKIRQAQSVQELLEIPIPETDESDLFAVYSVNSVPQANDEDAYLSIELHRYSRNNKGELQVKKEKLIKSAVITASERDRLRENAELMKEAIDEYRKAIEAEQNNPAESE